MKAYWESGNIAPRILDLGTRWRWAWKQSSNIIGTELNCRLGPNAYEILGYAQTNWKRIDSALSSVQRDEWQTC